MNWFKLLWGGVALVHGATLAANLRGYADMWARWLTGGPDLPSATGGLDRQPVQHFNAAARQWRTGRAGLAVPDVVPMLRAAGGLLAFIGAVSLVEALGGFSAF
ncbi:MAG: hypothetical protein HOV87_08250 [Catenulispora sp.]|nr:hypothetical protein [Catenulispora sp.]